MAHETLLLDFPHNIPVFAVVGILLLIFIIALCVCREIKNRPLSIPGLESRAETSAVTIQPLSHKPCGNGTVLTANNGVETGDASKIKVPTLQRKLPDIPVLPVPLPQETLENASDSQSPDTGSELYATVEASAPRSSVHNTQNHGEVSLDTATPEPPIEKQLQGNHSSPSKNVDNAANISALPTTSVKRTQGIASSGDSDVEHPYSHVQSHNYMRVKREHPYDWLKGQASEERDTDTDNYDDPQNISKSNTSAFRNWLQSDHTSFEPPPPPVPEKRFDLNSSGSGDEQLHPPSTLTAANAVSGWVSATDIPYVTSPLDSPTNHQSPVNDLPPVVPAPVVNEPVYNGSQNSTGSGPDIRYTSISVREPLANLRTQPRAQQTESYYSVVSEDEVDQTYAEIHSSRASDNGSTLYAAVDSVSSQHRELPPVPPPVESLRSLRTNHSRQASSSSITSGNFMPSDTDSSIPTSTPNTSSTDITLNLVNIDVKELHPSDRLRFTDRRTIHVSEPQNFMHLSNVEDMYAKVLKNKRLSLHHDAYLNGTSSSTSSFSSMGTKTLPPTNDSFPSSEILPDDDCVFRPNNLNNDNRPRSMISFSNYEKIDNTNLLSSCSVHNVSTYVPFDTNFQDTPVSSFQDDGFAFHRSQRRSNPDYESIREQRNHNIDPGYETVPGTDNNDPGYETVVLSDAMQNNTDPGYEAVILSSINPVPSDPGYETVNIHAANHLDPDYETINLFQLDQFDPGYEQIRNTYEETEPGYESIILKGREMEDEVPESGYEQINLNTANSETSISKNSEEQRDNKFHGNSSTDEEEEILNDPGYEKVKFSVIDNKHSSEDERLEVKDDNCNGISMNHVICNGNESSALSPSSFCESSPTEEMEADLLNKNSEETINENSISQTTDRTVQFQNVPYVNKVTVSSIEHDYATVQKHNSSDASNGIDKENFLIPHEVCDTEPCDNKST